MPTAIKYFLSGVLLVVAVPLAYYFMEMGFSANAGVLVSLTGMVIASLVIAVAVELILQILFDGNV